jgi:hypothetical protein
VIKKIEIRDLKSIKTSQNISTCNYAQTKKELKDTIQLLQKEAADSKRHKAKLEGQVLSLTTQKILP